MLASVAKSSRTSNKSNSSRATFVPKRHISEAKVVRYVANGAPQTVLKVQTEKIAPLRDNDILVKMLAAPINPADLNLVEGTYGTKANLPAIGGNEGVGVVLEVGRGVTNIKKNDHVIPSLPGLGTWRTHAVFAENEVISVPKDIPVEYAATISVNPCTAYRLLEDFVKLKEGDVLVQNGANSMVGTAVIQMAAQKGVKTINVIRNRGGYAENVHRLKLLGGHLVVSEDYFASAHFTRLISDLPKPKLGLNCVGGSSATDILRTLGEGGTMVTYGGMSKKPVTVGTGALIFKDLNLRGFWLTRWVQNPANAVARQQMLDHLFQQIRTEKLKLWMETWRFALFDQALEKAQQAQKDKKVVLLLDQ